MKKLMFAFAISLALTSCRFDVEPYNTTEILPNSEKESRDSVRYAMVIDGDTAGMAKLEEYYRQQGRELDMLPYYVVLVEKHGNESAKAKIVEICNRLKGKYPKLAEVAKKYGSAEPKDLTDKTEERNEK